MEVTIKPNIFIEDKKRPVIKKSWDVFDMFPIFIVTFASRRVTLIATYSKAQK